MVILMFMAAALCSDKYSCHELHITLLQLGGGGGICFFLGLNKHSHGSLDF
jgi:hypothetical protein